MHVHLKGHIFFREKHEILNFCHAGSWSFTPEQIGAHITPVRSWRGLMEYKQSNPIQCDMTGAGKSQTTIYYIQTGRSLVPVKEKKKKKEKGSKEGSEMGSDGKRRDGRQGSLNISCTFYYVPQ